MIITIAYYMIYTGACQAPPEHDLTRGIDHRGLGPQAGRGPAAAVGGQAVPSVDVATADLAWVGAARGALSRGP